MPAVALLSWPLIAVGIFAALGPARGLVWTLLIGFLFLPEDFAFDLPALPAYDKYSVISLSLVLGILVAQRHEKSVPELVDPLVRNVITLLIIVLFAGMAITVFDNTEPLMRSGRYQPGHSIRGLVSFMSDTLIVMVPFFLARRWLADPETHAEFLRAIVILAMLYSLLVLFERRMSPQLNRWFYGLEGDAWLQHIRGGGFRAMVFVGHGLVVGYFYMVAVLAAVGMARGTTGERRIIYSLCAFWLLIVLYLSRNMGATVLALVFVPALAIFSRRMLLWIATAVCFLFMFYPAAQQAHLIPNQGLVNLVLKVSAERAESIEFRFDNEEGLLARALEKPVFGWGGWGRSRVINEYGRDTSVTDGIWIIRLGQFGWVGYFSYFGLMTLPLVFLWRRKVIPPATMALAMITTANIIYLIPNSTLGVLAWMIVGTTAGFLQYGRTENMAKAVETGGPGARRGTVYSRFPTGPSRRSSDYRRELGRN